jgi:serine/threonine protein kinase
MTEAGRLLVGRYWLERRLAADGIAEEWRASDLVTGHPVAMVLLRAARAARAERFLAAARLTAQVPHPGIVRVRDYGKAGPDGPLFLVTEPVTGSSLAAVMRAGPLDPAWVLEVICQVASALGAAHSAGLVHRNVNPGNLLLAPGGAVKLTGFGLAQCGGSPGGDLSGLGLVAWACLAGAPPVPRATVPAGVAGLAADLIAAGAAARPVSISEVVTRCHELMAVPMRATRARPVGRADGTLLLELADERKIA